VTLAPATRDDDRPGRRESLELRAVGIAPVRLLFVELDGRVYVAPSQGSAAWFTASVREGQCETRKPGEAWTSAATRLVGPDGSHPSLPGEFDRKYGAGTWSRYFGGRSTILELTRLRAGLSVSDPDRIRGEFDALAESYDATVAGHAIDAYLKSQVTRLSVAALRDHDPLLELGSGTGIHTLPLLAAGHSVLAVDISDRMLDQLRRHAEASGASRSLRTRAGRVGELPQVLGDLPGSSIGGAFSAFGAIDVEGDLDAAVTELSRIIRPGGRLAFTSLNRPGWTPMLWDLAGFRLRSAGSRLRREVPPGAVRYPLRLFPRSAADWDRLLARGFRRHSAQALSCLAPPFDSERLVRFLGAEGAARAKSLDARLVTRRGALRSAEWLFLVYERSPSGATTRAGGPTHD